MDVIEFEDVSFRYSEDEPYIFKKLSISLPPGTVSLIGQNGTGKSTFLLLASGTLLPSSGRVKIAGIDTTELVDEANRQKFVSFIFQNMEFETDETIDKLLNYVYNSGCRSDGCRSDGCRSDGCRSAKDTSFIAELVEVFELAECLERKTQEISKGELQRTILVFSLLYGSRILVMDEPIFALQDYQKETSMDFLIQYAQENEISIYYSVHELDISKKYSQHLLLFHKDGTLQLGPTAELYERDTIEKAYDTPLYALKLREALYRDKLTSVNSNT